MPAVPVPVAYSAAARPRRKRGAGARTRVSRGGLLALADGAAPDHGLPGYAAGLLVDRLHEAIEAGQLRLVGDATDPDPPGGPRVTWGALRAIVQALFPEECVHERPPAAEANGDPPGSPGRAAAYEARYAAGRDLYASDDAQTLGDDRQAVAGHRRMNGVGSPVVTGWAAVG